MIFKQCSAQVSIQFSPFLNAPRYPLILIRLGLSISIGSLVSPIHKKKTVALPIVVSILSKLSGGSILMIRLGRGRTFFVYFSNNSTNLIFGTSPNIYSPRITGSFQFRHCSSLCYFLLTQLLRWFTIAFNECIIEVCYGTNHLSFLSVSETQ